MVDIIELFKALFTSTFKGNDFLEKGAITGVFRLAKENFFSGINNFEEHNILT